MARYRLPSLLLLVVATQLLPATAQLSDWYQGIATNVRMLFEALHASMELLLVRRRLHVTADRLCMARSMAREAPTHQVSARRM